MLKYVCTENINVAFLYWILYINIGYWTFPLIYSVNIEKATLTFAVQTYVNIQYQKATLVSNIRYGTNFMKFIPIITIQSNKTFFQV